MSVVRRFVVAACAAAAVGLHTLPAAAHSGPPYPIVSSRVEGAYEISVWTDPDATDDRSAAGRFWLTIEPVRAGEPVPAGTHARITIRPRRMKGVAATETFAPIEGDPSRQFAAVVLDHEGAFGVHVAIDGPAGPAEVETDVQATYDLRPPAILLALYVVPFVLAGSLWTALLVRRRKARARHDRPGR